MNHSMKLYEESFDDIKVGNQIIEVRLYDEKRRKLDLGDIVEFTKLPSLDEKIHVKIIGLLRYNSFRELVDDFPLGYFGSIYQTREDLLKAIYSVYSKEDEQKYGVLGIRIELI